MSGWEGRRDQFRADGFVVLERIIPDLELGALRAECQRFIEQKDREMDAAGTDVLGLDQRGKRYFVNDCSTVSLALRRFVLGDLMAEISGALLGDEVFLFNDQYVVKGAEVGTSFAWHQDSGYVGYQHPPYLTCWCALDDMSEANGTVHLLPYDRAGTREVVAHRQDERTNDLVGYSGPDPGIAIEVPAGSIACFSSTVFHRSGANTTRALRRAYIVQYSREPILVADRSRLRHQAVPLVRGGARVAECPKQVAGLRPG
jgi:ectoine hydroxylase-related dioxygenase (phytanoyl-CoA dioxygenase family)